MRKFVRAFAVVVALATFSVMALLIYVQQSVPDRFLLVPGQRLELNTLVPLEASAAKGSFAPEVYSAAGNSYQLELRMLGNINVKTVHVDVVDRPMVIPGGSPFGIKMFTEGVIIVGLSDISTENGRTNPAKAAGVKTGDILLSIDGNKITSNHQVGEIITASGGKPLDLQVRRNNELYDFQVTPCKAAGDGSYRAGIWVRDSSAGIGTLTYYDPASGLFTGLGHAICDVDTGELMPLNRGEVVDVSVTGVVPGQAGSPGELKGCFLEDRVLGDLCANTPTGVYGKASVGSIDEGMWARQMPVATKQEVETGPATILTTLEGNTPKEYSIMIEKLDLNSSTTTKNMVVRITDPELIAQTGGIVQGMSGSPILQNGMLVGSVTHVFVNDPLRGFGIFAENILTGANTAFYQMGAAA